MTKKKELESVEHMPLRDWFASQVIAGIARLHYYDSEHVEPDYDGAAKQAYAFADALIAARGK